MKNWEIAKKIWVEAFWFAPKIFLFYWSVVSVLPVEFITVKKLWGNKYGIYNF